VRDVRGPDAVGAYLFGSAVLGRLRPGSVLDAFYFAVATLTTSVADPELVLEHGWTKVSAGPVVAPAHAARRARAAATASSKNQR
jgi:hypothetical protein